MKKALEFRLKHGYNINCGKQRGHIASKVVMSGLRKDPKGMDVGSYSYKPSTNQHAVTSNKKIISELNTMIFQKVQDHLPKSEVHDLRLIKDMISMESLCPDCEGGTQFAIGKLYWSMYHNDKDFSMSILGVMCNECRDKDIVYYFLFPDYKLKVPMRNRDILVFNPNIYHCCSNPIYKNLYIFSQYTSSKTILTQASCAFRVT